MSAEAQQQWCHIQHSAACKNSAEGFRGDAKQVSILLTEKGFLKSLSTTLSSFLLYSYTMSSIQLQRGALLAVTKKDVSLYRQGYVLSQNELQYSQRERKR